MIAISALTIIYWVLAIASVLLGCVYQLVRIDKARHCAAPLGYDRVDAPFGATWSASLPTRKAPLFAGKEYENVVKFSAVAREMQSGDLLKFSGRSLFAWLIRIVRYTDTSHIGVIDVDDDGTIYVIDSREGEGVTRHDLFEDVKRFPGQWSWGPIARDLEHRYDRVAAIKYARDLVMRHTQYGYVGIALQGCIQIPVLREIVYLLQLHRLSVYSHTPFCSQMATDVCRKGNFDIVPGRESQLVAPQDVAQSMAPSTWVALLP